MDTLAPQNRVRSSLRLTSDTPRVVSSLCRRWRCDERQGGGVGFVLALLLVNQGCETSPPERVGTVRHAVEEEASQEGTDELVFTDPEVRVVVEDYLATLTMPSTAEERATKLAAVAALDDGTRTEQLAGAFDQTGLMQKWVVLFIMSKVPSSGGLSFASEFLTATVYDEYDAYMEHVGPSAEISTIDQGMKLVIRALHLVSNCVEAGISGADSLLLDIATEHEIEEVRHAAIREIEVEGTAQLKTDLRRAIQSQDEEWLDPAPFPENHTIELDAEDSAFDDPETPPE